MARPTAGGSGIRASLVPLPSTRKDPVAVFLAEVVDGRTAGLEDPQPEQAEQGDQGEVERIRRRAGGDDHRFELQM